MKNKIGSSKSMKKYQGDKDGSTVATDMAMSMKQLKKKYPDVDTGKAGDVRGSEINAGASKAILKKYNDTYNAFDKKFKGGRSYKKGGSVGKTPTTPKQKKFAALAAPKNKITFADKVAGVKKSKKK